MTMILRAIAVSLAVAGLCALLGGSPWTAAKWTYVLLVTIMLFMAELDINTR